MAISRANSAWSKRLTPRGFGVAVLLCLALLALLAVVQVAHVHPVDSRADQCPLCVALHSAAPAAFAGFILLMVRFGALTAWAELRVPARNLLFRLFTRPPPAAL